MADELPIYLPGDTIRFQVEVEHNFNLGDAGAVFRRREQEEEANPFRLPLDATEIEEVGRVGTKITSTVVFEATVTRHNSLPGEYDLETIRGVPLGAGDAFGTGRRQDALETELGAPEGVAFRIVELPAEPVTEIRDWALEKRDKGRRYLS